VEEKIEEEKRLDNQIGEREGRGGKERGGKDRRGERLDNWNEGGGERKEGIILIWRMR